MTHHSNETQRTTHSDRPVVHRITTSTAAVVNDPERDDLAQLVAEVSRSGRGSFLIAQSRAGQPGETYLQAVRQPGGWALEACDDGVAHHMRVEVEDTALVEDLFMWWTHDLPAWRRLAWEPVARDQQWLTSA